MRWICAAILTAMAAIPLKSAGGVEVKVGLEELFS